MDAAPGGRDEPLGAATAMKVRLSDVGGSCRQVGEGWKSSPITCWRVSA